MLRRHGIEMLTLDRQMVPIPEGVERSDEEPPNELYGNAAQSDGGGSSTSSLTTEKETKGADLDRVMLGSGTEEDELRG